MVVGSTGRGVGRPVALSLNRSPVVSTTVRREAGVGMVFEVMSTSIIILMRLANKIDMGGL